MFLTVEELQELTGYRYHCRQIDWLTQHKWKFEVTSQHRPKVARSYFESRMGGNRAASQEPLPTLPIRPNFQALNQPRAR